MSELKFDFKFLRCQSGGSDKFYCVLFFRDLPIGHKLAGMALTGYGKSGATGNWSIGNHLDAKKKLTEKQSARKGYERDKPYASESTVLRERIGDTLRNNGFDVVKIMTNLALETLTVTIGSVAAQIPEPEIAVKSKPVDMSWGGDW